MRSLTNDEILRELGNYFPINKQTKIQKVPDDVNFWRVIVPPLNLPPPRAFPLEHDFNPKLPEIEKIELNHTFVIDGVICRFGYGPKSNYLIYQTLGTTKP